MLKRVMIIAGETSGDLHGGGVVRELRRRIPDIEVFGMGGDRMREEGMECNVHVGQMSFMGFLEVAKNLRLIRTVEKKLENLLVTRRPDVLVLIDYPGFNLRFARKAKRRGIRVLYYISPQVWAWHKGRAKKMKGFVDRMKVVFPFEVGIYRDEGINVEFVGHPLAESLGANLQRDAFMRKYGLDPSLKLVGLFPGSRRQEIHRIFPVMALAGGILRNESGVQLAVSVAPHLDRSLIERALPGKIPMTFVEYDTYELMRHADAAIVTSGTATLETGWFGTPMVVVYRTSALTYLIGRLLVDIRNIGLVNIVAGEQVVPEFVQGAMTPEHLASAIRKMLDDPAYADEIRRKLGIIRTRLGTPGASQRVVDGIIELAEAA